MFFFYICGDILVDIIFLVSHSQPIYETYIVQQYVDPDSDAKEVDVLICPTFCWRLLVVVDSFQNDVIWTPHLHPKLV